MAISTIGTDALASTAVTSAKLASGAPSRSQLPAGTVLQVQSTTKTDLFSTTSATPSDITGLTVSITPTSASSKILVRVVYSYGGTQDAYGALYLFRNSTSICVSTAGTGSQMNATASIGVIGSNGNGEYKNNMGCLEYLDSPATTSSITYKLQLASTYSGRQVNINKPGVTDSATYIISATSTITAMEIAQ